MFAFNTSEQTQDMINKVAISNTNTAANYWSFTDSPKRFTYTRTSTTPAASSKFTFYTHSSDGSVGVKMPPTMTIGNIESLSANFTVVNTIPGDTQNPDNVVIFFSIYTKPKGDGTDRASWYNSRIAITPQINTNNNGHRIISGVSYTITPDHFGAAGTALSTSFSSSDLVTFILMSSNSIEPLINWRFSLDNVFVNHNFPLPIISSLDKYYGNAGETLTLNGSRLTNMTNVNFNTTSISVTPTTDTQAAVTIPDIEGSTLNIKIKNDYLASNTVTFTYLPFITSFNSSFGIENTLLTVNGKHLTSTTAILFNNTNVNASFVTDSQVTTIVPYGLSGSTVNVTAQNSMGSSNVQSFSYYNYPAITSITPTTGLEQDTITINGNYLSNVSNVLFGTTNTSFKIIDAYMINASIPTRVSINTSIQVSGLNGSSNYASFSYMYLTPIISSLNKTSGIPGDSVIITGNNLLESTVSLSNTSVVVQTNTDTSVTITLPYRNPGNGTLSISTPGGTSNSVSFTYNYQVPIITHLDKTDGIPGDVVKVYGTHLLGTHTVLYNTTPTNFTNTIDTEVTTIVPYCLPGYTNIKVKGVAGDSETLRFFCNYETPVINTLSIKNGKMGNKMVINGLHLIDAKVSFNLYDKTTIKPEKNTDHSITVTVPKGTSGLSTSINVKTKGGTSNTLPFTYDYLQPIIKSTTISGNTLIIRGDNFLGISKIQCISKFPKLNMQFTLGPDTPNNKITVDLNGLKGFIRLNFINDKVAPMLQTTNAITVP